MCNASLLQNIGVFSTFHVEKPTALLSFSNVKERRKKIKIIQRLKKKEINKITSKAITDMVLKKKKKV
jgi:hypothetical protein